MNKPLLSIACLTFNHKDYITQTVQSFMHQKADFDFEIVIGDGGSNDGNREQLLLLQKQFGEEKIKLLFPDVDPGIGGMLNQIFLACSGKYIAICEGDDYWVDVHKSQRQVDFLEDHQDYSLIHSEIGFVNMQGVNIEPTQAHPDIVAKRKSGVVFDDLFTNGNFIYTPTVCFRAKDLNKKFLEKADTWYLFDIWYWLHLAYQGKFHFEKCITADYRRHPEGVTQNMSFFNGKYRAIHLDIIKSIYKTCRSQTNRMAIIKKIIFYIKSGATAKEWLFFMRLFIGQPKYLMDVYHYWRTK